MKRTLALFLCVLFVMSLCACGGEAWPTTGLGAMLPKPSSGTVKNIMDSSNGFLATVENVADNEFDNYVSACKEKGFTIDADETSGYEAFNEDGYKLSVSDYGKSMNISLDKPVELGTLRWPDSALGKAVPKPSSEKGNVESESDSSFVVYVGEMGIDQFNDYVDTCSKAGFNIDYDCGDKYYYAYDKNNYYLSISYEGFNIILVKAEIKEDETTADKSADSKKEESGESEKSDTSESSSSESSSSKSSSSKSSSSKADSNEVSADFKEMMDGYESFMNEYVEFMKKYKNSDDVSGMLTEYSEMMTSYSEYMEKIKKIDTDSLSEADYAYYVEVTGRVNKKLAEI